MFHAREAGRRQPAAPVAVEPLEDRIALTAGAAYVEIPCVRAITHLSTRLLGQVDRIQTLMTRRVSRVDARPVGTRLGDGHPTQAREALAHAARATAGADARVGRVVATANRKLGAFAGRFNRRLAAVTGRFGRLGATIRGVNPSFTTELQNALSAVDAGIPAEARAAQGPLQGIAGPAIPSVAQAGTSGATVEAQAEAAAGQPADSGGSQLASEPTAVAQFWERYYSSFNPPRSEMAAIVAAQSPPSTSGAAPWPASGVMAAARV